MTADVAEIRILALYTMFHMLPELHRFKTLFYIELVSVITSGHVTKLAVTAFHPP